MTNNFKVGDKIKHIKYGIIGVIYYISGDEIHFVEISGDNYCLGNLSMCNYEELELTND